MSIIYQFKKYLGRRKKGSALIITLGVLSLLLIVCMVFAFDAMSSSKAAKNYSISVQARLLNESGVKRATSSLDLFKGGSLDANHTFLNPGSEFFPDPGTGDWAGCKYLPMVTTTDPITSDTVEAFHAIMSDSSKIAFHYTPEIGLPGVGTSATWDSILVEDSVVGAMTYLIIDQTGKLDPGTVGNSTTPLTRTGQKLSEVNLVDALGGVYRPSYATDSWYSLVDFVMSVDPTSVQADKLKIKSTIFPGTVPTPEEFWFPDWEGGSSDSEFNANELFGRMDITKVDGTNITAQQLFNFLLLSDSQVAVLPATDSAKSLWLKKSKVEALTTTHGDAEDKKMARKVAAQMVLNMLDAADGDDKAKAAYVYEDAGEIKLQVFDDQSVAGFTPKSPVANTEAIVYGVEDVGGIHDLLVRTESNWDSTAGSLTMDFIFDYRLRAPSQAGVNPKISMKLKYQLLVDSNPYSSNSTGNPVAGSTPVEFELTTSKFSARETDGAATPKWSILSNNVPALPLSPHRITLSTGSSVKLTNLEITEIVVYHGPDIYRKYPVCAYGDSSIGSFSTWQWTGTGVTTSSSGSEDQVVHIRSTDPLFADIDPADTLLPSSIPPEPTATTRVNATWSAVEGSVFGNMVVGSSSLTGIGLTIVTYDTEEYCDVECQNNPFSRIAQLGKVHSPHTPNKSIRFWTKDSTTSSDDWQDAYLLDMFTTNPLPSRKININTSSPDVLKALFANVTGLTATTATNAQENVHTLNGTTGGMPFLYRGDIYSIFDEKLVTAAKGLNFGLTDDNDAEKVIEEVIELLGTRQNYFTIITTARAIKDIGSADLTGINSRCMQLSSAGAGRFGLTLGSYKTITAVYRDAWKAQATSAGERDTRILRVSPLED